MPLESAMNIINKYKQQVQLHVFRVRLRFLLFRFAISHRNQAV